MLTAIASVTARDTTAYTARRAFCGFPAPNSFETPLLYQIKITRFAGLTTSYICSMHTSTRISKRVQSNLPAEPSPYGIAYSAERVLRLLRDIDKIHQLKWS